jgi:hypothetical protein
LNATPPRGSVAPEGAMTEREWLTSTDLPSIRDALRGKASGRKLRLFDVACCRRVWSLLPDDARRAVEVAELYADGRASRESLDEAFRRAHDAAVQVQAACREVAEQVPFSSTRADEQLRTLQGYYLAGNSCRANTEWHWPNSFALLGLACRMEESAGAGRRPPAVAHAPYLDFLRDIFGPLPFRPVAIDPVWLSWNSGTVPAIARSVYDERAFHDMPILADALEDAGCDNQDILAHCRSGGEHVRGCWVVDLLLGREYTP